MGVLNINAKIRALRKQRDDARTTDVLLEAECARQAGWQHCGMAHHFIGASDCLYHLATFVNGGRYLVSTVGDYRPSGVYKPAITIGAGADSFYETMVFKCDPTTLEDGEPTTLWSEHEQTCERYATIGQANEGHLALCKEYDIKEVEP